ncbi:MAG: redoxin domain-containing protein [Bacteroidetes bacterium]|nr:redoxin domain-containing protein [Bacteroidota bacterium]
MNRYSLIILVSIALSSGGCKQGKDKPHGPENLKEQTRIEGILQGGKGRQVLLEEMAVREYIPIDTVICDSEGRFQISFEPEQIAFYVLRTGQTGYITLLIEPGEKINFSDSPGQHGQYRIQGSGGSEQLMMLATEHKRTLNELGDISRQIRDYRDHRDYPEIKRRLDQRFDSITTSFRAFSLDFIEKNQESLSILIALYNLYGQGLPVFHPGKDFQTYRFVDSVMQSTYPEFEAARSLHAQVLEADATNEKNGQDHRPEVGEIAPDFVSSRPDGSQMALSDLKGDYVILCFWAGWSSLSREENRYLKEVWDMRGDFPIKILQVSFDGDGETWNQAIEQDHLTWDHMSDLVRWESLIADLYMVEKIPSNYLIGPGGKIIARDLFGGELVDKLEKLYSNY